MITLALTVNYLKRGGGDPASFLLDVVLGNSWQTTDINMWSK